MAGGLHGSARTTPQVRAELQASKETSGALAKRYGLSRNTVTKWRARATIEDAPTGPRSPHSTVLTAVEEAMVVEFRRRSLLPLDDVLGCLCESIPKLTRSSLHRCLERHGISRLPESPDHASKRGKFAETPIGYVHIDISELRLAQGKLNMFLAIDRVSKFTYVEFRDDAGKINGADFLRGVVEAFPYAIHTVLTDTGMAFADLPKNRGSGGGRGVCGLLSPETGRCMAYRRGWTRLRRPRPRSLRDATPCRRICPRGPHTGVSDRIGGGERGAGSGERGRNLGGEPIRSAGRARNLCRRRTILGNRLRPHAVRREPCRCPSAHPGVSGGGVR